MARPVRIFYLITELDPGGAEQALFRLVTGIDREMYQPVVGCLCGAGGVGRWLQERGVEVLHFRMGHPTDLAALGRIAAEMRRRRPDLVHTFLFHANLIGRLAAFMARVPRVISSVRVEEPRWLHLLGDRLTRRLVDLEVCVSESSRAFTARRAGIPESKLAVVPNGVDLRHFDTVPQTFAGWRLGAGQPVIGTIGRLDEQKDPVTFFRAAALVRERFPDVLFAWAGGGPLRLRAEIEVSRLGIGDAVRFLGYLSDVRPFLARLAVFALASRWEGMPNVLLEAMAMRRPVVAAAVGGCPEIVADGDTGYLVPAGDPEVLAARICDILADRDRARAMGEAGRRRVEKRFSNERVIREWVNVYRRVLTGGRGAERA